MAEQRRIIDEVERLLSVNIEVEEQVERSIRRATRLRQSILKWAFEGKLVDQDPTDEPAEALLARIQAERAGASAAASTPKKPRGRKAKTES